MTFPSLDEIVADIYRVATAMERHPGYLHKNEYLKAGEYKDSHLRHYGGYAGIILDNFGSPPKNLGVIQGQKLLRNQLKRLESSLGERDYFTQRFTETLERLLKTHPIPVQRKKVTPYKPVKKQREIVAFISDTHFGLDIDSEEIPGNKYNWQVAARRMGKFAHEIATYKVSHRAETPRLRLCLGGDLCQGIIHFMSDKGTDLTVYQSYGAAWVLVQFIDYLRRHFKHIVVECTSDNHMRFTHKGPDRSPAQKYDSFATLLHGKLQAAYRGALDVTFNVPKTPYTEFDLLGHRVLMTHGDTVLRSGGLNSSVNIGKITKQVQARIAATTDKRLDLVMMGHVHVPLFTTLDNGTELVINGTGSGTDAYAQSIGFHHNNPIQVMFEATEDYVVGDFRKVSLRDADQKAGYEEIIRPYENQLAIPELHPR